MIDFYTASTPNGIKIGIALEELGAPYRIHDLSLADLEHKTPDFLRINPNGRVPAIIDREANNLAVFESGAILIYLAEKYGGLLPKDPAGRAAVIQWVMLQVSGIGPMQGQANLFLHYWGEKLPGVVSRYKNETRRLYGVLDKWLNGREWLAAKYSIADIACWPWVRISDYAEIALDNFPYLSAWSNRMASRPACIHAISHPAPRQHADRNLAAQKIIQR